MAGSGRVGAVLLMCVTCSCVSPIRKTRRESGRNSVMEKESRERVSGSPPHLGVELGQWDAD